MIEKNFGGVRIDGTNATIIGEGDGNFIADRNGIARVWMDHALWPQMTTKLYIDQTGDVEILNRKVPYFKDAQTCRGTQTDEQWDAGQGSLLRTKDGEIYTGSILEHLLVQQLTAFYEVGSHNVYRLRGADWNDALDMASERGESVAFTCAYAGNLRELASMIRLLESRSGEKEAVLPEELQILLNGDAGLFEDPDAKMRFWQTTPKAAGTGSAAGTSPFLCPYWQMIWSAGPAGSQVICGNRNGSTEGQTRDGLTATTITTDARWKVSSPMKCAMMLTGQVLFHYGKCGFR